MEKNSTLKVFRNDQTPGWRFEQRQLGIERSALTLWSDTKMFRRPIFKFIPLRGYFSW